MSFTEPPYATPQPFVARADRCEWSADDLEHWFDGADREAALLGYGMGELHTLLLLRLIDARTSLRQHWSARAHLLFACGLAQVLSGQSWQRVFPLPWDPSLPDPKSPLALRHLNITLAYVAILHSTVSGANRKMLARAPRPSAAVPRSRACGIDYAFSESVLALMVRYGHPDCCRVPVRQMRQLAEAGHPGTYRIEYASLT